MQFITVKLPMVSPVVYDCDLMFDQDRYDALRGKWLEERKTPAWDDTTFWVDNHLMLKIPVNSSQISRHSFISANGTCDLSGNESRLIGPLRLSQPIQDGKVVLQLTDAVQSWHGGGAVITLETSKDGENWHRVEKGGFIDGPLTLKQDDWKEGKIYGAQIDARKIGSYVRVRYDARGVASFGFNGTFGIWV